MYYSHRMVIMENIDPEVVLKIYGSGEQIPHSIIVLRMLVYVLANP